MNFLFGWMAVYAENDLRERTSHLYLFFKIETFKGKKVKEAVGCINLLNLSTDVNDSVICMVL